MPTVIYYNKISLTLNNIYLCTFILIIWLTIALYFLLTYTSKKMYMVLVLEELVLSGNEKHHKSWKEDFEKIIKQFILPEVPCYVLYR